MEAVSAKHSPGISSRNLWSWKKLLDWKWKHKSYLLYYLQLWKHQNQKRKNWLPQSLKVSENIQRQSDDRRSQVARRSCRFFFARRSQGEPYRWPGRRLVLWSPQFCGSLAMSADKNYVETLVFWRLWEKNRYWMRLGFLTESSVVFFWQKSMTACRHNLICVTYGHLSSQMPCSSTQCNLNSRHLSKNMMPPFRSQKNWSCGKGSTKFMEVSASVALARLNAMLFHVDGEPNATVPTSIENLPAAQQLEGMENEAGAACRDQFRGSSISPTTRTKGPVLITYTIKKNNWPPEVDEIPMILQLREITWDNLTSTSPFSSSLTSGTRSFVGGT